MTPATLMLIIIFGVLFVVMPLGIFAKKYLDKKNIDRELTTLRGENLTIKTYLVSVNTYLKMYAFFKSSTLFDKYTSVLYYKLKNVSSYTITELQILTVQFSLAYIFLPMSMAMLSFIAVKDFIISLLMFFLTKVVIDNTIMSTLDDRYLQMMLDFKDFVSRVRQAFTIVKSPSQALQMVAKPASLAKQVGDLERLLEGGADDMRELNKFIELASFRLMKTFAIVCFRAEDEGDTPQADGSSVFLQALAYIINEANQDIRRFSTIKRKFPIFKKIILGMLLVIPILTFITTRFVFPATAIFLYGKYGYAARAILFIYILRNYNKIVKLNDTADLGVTLKNRYIASLLATKRWAQSIVKIMKPKKMKSVRREERLIRDSLTSWDLEYLTAERIFYSTVYFFLILLILVSGQIFGKTFERNTMMQASMLVPDYDEKTSSNLAKIDEDYLGTKGMSEEELVKRVGSTLGKDVDSSEVLAEAERIRLKRKNVNAPILPWYFVTLAIAFGFVGYKFPTAKLKERTKMIRQEEEDDALQLQTLISVIMYTSIDTLSCLEWMAKTSSVHKPILDIAVNDYLHDSEFALRKLRQSCHSLDMKRIVDDLMSTVEDTTLQQAFNNLADERTHIMIQRQELINDAIADKLNKAAKLANQPLLPIAAAIVLVPMIFLALNLVSGLKEQGLF